MSNMYAVNLARYRCCPDIKENGLSATPRLVMFTSQEVRFLKSHYKKNSLTDFFFLATFSYFLKVNPKYNLSQKKLFSVFCLTLLISKTLFSGLFNTNECWHECFTCLIKQTNLASLEGMLALQIYQIL